MIFSFEARPSDSPKGESVWRTQSEGGGSVTPGVSILDTAYEAGYFDQPHLTRSLKQFIGRTPAQILQLRQPE